MSKLKFLKHTKNKRSGSYTTLSVIYEIDNAKTLNAEFDIEKLDTIFQKDTSSFRPPTLPSYDFSNVEGEAVLTATNNLDNYAMMLRLVELLNEHGLDVLSDSGSIYRLEIESQLTTICDLPWEMLFNDKSTPTYVIRRKYGTSYRPNVASTENYAFLISHGFDESKNFHKIADDFQKEAAKAYKSIFIDRTGHIKPQILTVLRYLNKESIKNFNLEYYSVLHLMLHGREDGYLGFEDPHDHWKIEWISPNDFIDIIKLSHYELIFLSCCYSGYGDIERISLAQELVNSGIASSVVAFNGGIGSDKTLPEFVDCFYDRFGATKDVEDAFRGAVDLLRQNKSPYLDKPVLFTGGFV